MLMSHGDNHDRLIVDTVNERIRKAREKETAYFRLNLRRYSRMTLDESHRAIQLIEEVATEALSLLFVDVMKIHRFPAYLLIVAISSLGFAAYHYLGAEAFNWRTFVFRTVAGEERVLRRPRPRLGAHGREEERGVQRDRRRRRSRGYHVRRRCRRM